MSEVNKYLNPDVIAQTLILTVEDTHTYFNGEEVKNTAQLDEMISREYSTIELIKKVKEYINERSTEITEMVMLGDSPKPFDFELAGYENILEILEEAT